MNRNYQKGVRLERKIVNEARADGCISFRSAGSHSPFDVVIVDLKLRKIAFVQCKSGQWDEYKMNKLEDKWCVNDGPFDVIFRVEGDEN